MIFPGNQFDRIRAEMESAQANDNYELLAKLDKQLLGELSAADMKQLASNSVQLQQLTELLNWYRSAIETYEIQKEELRTELDSRAKNKNAVGRYQAVAFGT